MRHVLILIATLLIASPSHSAETLPGPIKAVPFSVYDGDTFKAIVHIWLNQTVSTSIRIAGIDTPEIRGKCEEEKLLALKAKKTLSDLLSTGEVRLWAVKYGKWAGRVIAHVTVGDVNVGDTLLNLGLARAYDGGKRTSWCDI